VYGQVEGSVTQQVKGQRARLRGAAEEAVRQVLAARVAPVIGMRRELFVVGGKQSAVRNVLHRG